MTTTVSVARREVTLSHGKTRYLEAGTGDPVILLHGVSASGGADDWRPAIQHLGAGYRVIAPDMLGWPPSDIRDGIDSFPNLTDHVREFQDGLGLRSSHVVGATMGGWIAGLFAYESPSRVDKLVMTGNPGFHGAPNDRLAAWEIPDDDRVRNALLKQMDGVSADEVESLVREKIAKMQEPGYADAFKQAMSTMADHDNRARYSLLRRLPFTPVPMLFLLGRADPSSSAADELQRLAPESSLHIIEEGGHQVHYENTEEFSRVVSEFLG